MADRAIGAWGVCNAKHAGTVQAYGTVEAEINARAGLR
jgi:hypothetical protein